MLFFQYRTAKDSSVGGSAFNPCMTNHFQAVSGQPTSKCQEVFEAQKLGENDGKHMSELTTERMPWKKTCIVQSKI